MNWDDSAYLVSKNRYSENSIIAEVFTENHGKISGIIFGGTSKKIKNYLQIGNKIYVNYNSKSITRIGYFKIEILKALTPIYFDENQKLSCITSAMHLIKLLTAEAQSNKEIFKDKIEGFDPGAPKNPKIGKKFLITTIITSILFIIIYYIVDLGFFNLRNFLQ